MEKRRRNHQSLGYDYKSNALGKHIDGIGYKLHFPSTTVDCCILCSRMTSMLDSYALCVCVQHSCFTALTYRFGYEHGILRHKNRCQSHIFLVKPIKWCKNWILAHFFIEIKSKFLKFRLLSFSLIFFSVFYCFLDFFLFQM